MTKMRWLLGAVAAMGICAGVAMAQTPPRLASEPSATAPATRTAEATGAQGEKLSFLSLLLRGGWAMIPLGACSLIGLALMIERGLALRRSQVLPAEFLSQLDRVFRTPADLDAALTFCRERPSSISRIMAAGLRKLPEGIPAAEMAISDQGATEVARMRRNLRLLHGIAAITPTLGLLGTVWGMIRAFEAASRMGLGSHSEGLTQGIYEALVATMTGLMIAVPVLIVYYIYLGIIDRVVLELNDVTQAFMEKHQRAGFTTKPGPVPGEPDDVNATAPTSV